MVSEEQERLSPWWFEAASGFDPISKEKTGCQNKNERLRCETPEYCAK